MKFLDILQILRNPTPKQRRALRRGELALTYRDRRGPALRVLDCRRLPDGSAQILTVHGGIVQWVSVNLDCVRRERKRKRRPFDEAAKETKRRWLIDWKLFHGGGGPGFISLVFYISVNL